MLELAAKRPFYFFLHSDAEDNEGILDKLFDLAMIQRGRWGVLFTNYDALACFNTEAFRAVGGWDENLKWYRSECDMYRRLRLAGYPTLESRLRVKHTPSSTLNADFAIKARVDAENVTGRAYYIRKWGGTTRKRDTRCPSMAKLKPGEKRVQLSFQRPEDLRLFSFIEKEAYRCRWDIATFCIASLTEAFKDRMEEDEVDSIAAEAAQKVRERTAVPCLSRRLCR